MRRLIGYATTNSGGVATLNYTGQGLGEVDIVAETGGEMLFHHTGISGVTETDSFQYSTSDMTVTPSSTGTTVVNNANAVKSYWANKTGSTTSDDRDYGLPITIEFDYTIYNNTSVSLQLWKSNTSGDYVGVNLKNALDNYSLSSAHIKVVLADENIKVYVNGNQYQNSSFSFISSGLVAVRFICGANTGFKYKNFFIYRGSTQLTSDPIPLLDCKYYDKGMSGTGNHNDNVWSEWSNYPRTVTRNSDYTSITQTNSGTTAYLLFKFDTFSPNIIEYDFYKKDGLLTQTIAQLRDNSRSVLRGFSLSSFTNKQLGTWYHIKFDFVDMKIYLDGNQIDMSNISPTYLYIACTDTTTEVRYKNFKVY